MDALSSAIVQTANATQQSAVAQEAGVLVLKNALDIQQASAQPDPGTAHDAPSGDRR